MQIWLWGCGDESKGVQGSVVEIKISWDDITTRIHYGVVSTSPVSSVERVGSRVED